jgi:hypothetical protein
VTILAIDPLWIWIAVGVVGLLIVAGLFARGARHARTNALRDKYGRVYEHVVAKTGSRTRAEKELAARAEEVEQYNIRPLTAVERDRYRADWLRVEQHFVERPTTAVVEADELVADIMRVQGYPMGDFDKHVADLSVKHPRVIEHYRAGHRVIGLAPGSASTEDLRQSMLHYRALFEELIGLGTRATDLARDIPRENEVSATSPRRTDVLDIRDEDRV